jgi:hypothetical protein
LLSSLSLEAAVDINRQCQRFDGIQDIDAAGTVHFTVESAGVMREELGYDCEHLRLDECEERAEELAAKFAEYRQRVSTEEQYAA